MNTPGADLAPAGDQPALAPPPRRLQDLPGPRPMPVVGNLLQLDTPRMHLQLEAWCEEFGALFLLRLGRRRLLVCGDHEATAAALRDRPDGFRRTVRMEEIGAEMGLLPGVFGANGEAWKRQRRMVMAGFDPTHVRGYHPALVVVAQRLARRWQAAALKQQSIDLQADLMRYTVDAIAGLAFGTEVNTLESDGDIIQRHLDKVFPTLFQRMMSPLPTWRWLRTPAVREVERSMAALNQAVQGFVSAARARLEAQPERRAHPPNLLEAMIVAADEPGSGIDDAQVAGNVFTMLLAGEDTTANTLAWMIDLLWRHPAALARATEEVRRVAGRAEAPTLEQLAALDYVEACAHETMRLKPVAPLVGLEALHDTVVGDVAIGASTVVINVMRRDSVREALVPRATAFEPERWLADGHPGAMAASARRTSMPFGAGPRICPGRYLALMEMKLAIATLLGGFDITSVDTAHGGPAEERLSFTMTPVGLRMALRPRP
jgi:cytochrome P450